MTTPGKVIAKGVHKVIGVLHGLEPKEQAEILCRVAASFARLAAPNLEEARLFAKQMENTIMNAWKLDA